MRWPVGLVGLLALAKRATAANVTSLSGTWSSGSGSVLTGTAFGNPTIDNTFIYPNVSGRSLSFTDDGFYEEATFMWNSNATDHHCIEAVMIWQHGTYQITTSGTITTVPFAADGRIQVQNACAAQSSVISYYSQDNLFASWKITTWRKQYMLQLGQYDGALMPRMYLVDADPTPYMFPTEALTNTSNTLSGSTKRW